MRRWIFLFILVAPKLYGQCPTIDLTIPSTSCIGEPINIINNTTGATSYEWDFCPGDLLEDITAESAGTLSGLVSVRDIADVNIAGEGIYAFVVAENAKLLRIEFGLTVDTNYTTTDLGNLGGLLSVARGVSYVNEGGDHKLLIGNSNGTVVLVDFGTDLTSTPSSSTISGLSGLSGLRGLKLYTEGNNYLAYAIGTGASFSEIELIDFGNALSNTPTQSTLSTTGTTGLTDFSLIRDCDQWYGLTAGFSSNEIYKIMLGSDPRTVDSQQTLTGISVPLGVELRWELGNWHGFVSSDAGNFYRIDFGADFTATGSEVFNNLTNFSLLASNVGFDIIKVDGRQYGLATNFSTSTFSLLNFGETCNTTPSLSTVTEPEISYSQSGNQSIELITYNAGGNSQRTTESISLSADMAPSITFTTTNECITQSNTFTPVDGGGLTYAWDFDNNGSIDSTTPSPQHTLGSIGDHDVKLTVDDGSCTNVVVNTISIFPVPPTPTFTSPGPPHCANAELSFNNTSNESNHAGATITYDWNFQEGTSTDKDANFTFATPGTKDIELTMSIPGCTSPMASDQLTLIDGPTVAFSYGNYCFGETIQFTNETTGLNIVGYVWDFDDGSGTSSDVNPQHLYVSTGTYDVSLTATNASGCQTSFVQEIIVTDDLIDFSVSNTIENLPSQFTSIDQTLSGDAITSWNWDFDGLGSSTSENPIFTFPSASTFSVTLNITTQAGCSGSVVKNIEIAEAICPTNNLTIPASACLNEDINLISNSVNFSSFEWDLCPGDLLEDIIAESAGTLSGVSSLRDIAAVNIAGEGIYAFVVAENAKLLRIEFGLTVDTNYTTTDLGNLGGLLSVARGVSYVNEGGDHKLLIGNSNGTVVLVDFGTDLTSTPSSSTISGLSGLSGLRGLKLYTEGNNYLAYAIGTGASFSEIELIDFGNALSNTPTQSTLSTTGTTGLTDFSLIRDCDQWYGLTAGFSSNEIYKIMLGSDPRTVDSQQTLTGISVPLGVELRWELGNWHGFVSSDAGNFYRIDFGADFTATGSEVFNDLTNFGLLTTNVGFDIIKVNGRQYGLATNFGTSAFTLLNFGETCNTTPSLSTATELQISYSQSGTQSIEFISHGSNGNPLRSMETISILNNSAPVISFTTTNECITQSNTFTPVDGGGLTYAWDLDNDGSTDSTDPTPNYTFGSTGDHIVKLTVNDGTCSNQTINTFPIFPAPPTPSFNYVHPGVLCSGAAIQFTNTSDESNHVGSTLTYSWDYNGEGNSTDKDGGFAFNTDGTKTITLTASIPGCSSPSAEPDLTLIAGPSVNFSYGDKCLGDVTQFTNLSTGTGITSQTWDFGDLNGTTDLSPSHEYEAAGNYNVSLTVDNLAGCSNSLIIPLTIDDRPNAAFNMGVGCEGQVVGFEDQSTVNNANIESYTWDFGGQGSSSQEDPLFIFETQGTYQVKLTVESTFGCVDEVTKNLNVQLAPVAAFDIDLGCLNASTQFIDRTDTEVENPINIWYWDINGDIIPNTQNPVEIFDTPGDYTATLTVTPGNLCISSVSHDFTIHELPVADFTVDKTCDNEFTSFTDASTSSTTSIIAYSWQFGDEGTGNSNPTAFNFDRAGDHLISFTITDEVGCESSAFQTITINPSPVAAFTVNKDIGPAPLLIDFTNTSTGATSHFWKFNDSAQTTSIETSPDFTYSNLGDYTAELISTNDFGCSDTTSIPLTVAEPLLDLELLQVSQEESEGRISLSLTVKNSGNVVINGFDIRIDLDNNSSIFESYEGTLLRNQTVNYPLNFTFSKANNNIGYTCISLIDLEEGQSDINIVNNEGCIDFEQKIIVENSYPNPAESGSSKVRLNMILPTESPVQIFLLDATGGILYENVYSDTSLGLNSFFLDVYSLEQGIYFIKVVYDNVQSTQRFVKL